MRDIHEIEENLDQLQLDYLDEEDDKKQITIERKFCELLREATEVDGVLRLEVGVTIHNWVREESNDIGNE